MEVTDSDKCVNTEEAGCSVVVFSLTFESLEFLPHSRISLHVNVLSEGVV